MLIVSILKSNAHILLAFLCLLCVFLSPGIANATDAPVSKEGITAPRKALISPHGARLEVLEEKTVTKNDGVDSVEFIIPQHARNLQLAVEGRTIIRWTSYPVIRTAESAHSTKRAQVESHRMDVAAKLATVKARVNIWKAQVPQAGPHELTQRQNLMAESMPPLAREQEELERQLKLLDMELAQMPETSGIGKKISVNLAPAKDNREKVKVTYSYDVDSCGWSAVYDFNARPGKNNDSTVDVHLMAEVWQYTGIDWPKTEIVLATRGNGPREPEPLPEWRVGAPAPAPQPRAMVLKANAARTAGVAAYNEDVEAAPAMAPVSSDLESVYASWTLSTKGLPEGRSLMQIAADAWKAPLQWLARPVRGDARVWLLAKYTLPTSQAWPAGIAQYSVDGQSVGEGYFTPKEGEAVLYFGADPRVQIRTTVDSNKQGETGIINTNKTWTWAWTYTIFNEHSSPVKVRVERPEPMIGNDDISVSYKDKPESVKDDKEHLVYWLVDVPPHGKSIIQHGITITAPVKLPLQPDVP